jgi:hypothetical protein
LEPVTVTGKAAESELPAVLPLLESPPPQAVTARRRASRRIVARGRERERGTKSLQWRRRCRPRSAGGRMRDPYREGR